MRVTRRAPLASALLLVLLVVAACSPASPGGSKESSVQPTPTAPILAKEDVLTALGVYIAALNTQLGGGKVTQYGNPVVGPCEEDTVERPSRTFNVLGGFTTPVAAAQQLAVLDRIHQLWQREGWQIGTWATADSGTRHLSGLDPTNGYDVAINTDFKKGSFSILIGTPCYRYPSTSSS